MKLSSRRFVASAGAVAASALSVSVLALMPASAGAAPRLSVDTTSIRAAAGSCAVVVVTPLDQFGVPSTVPDTVTVTLSENPSDPAQDLDFCVSSPSDPSYSADKPTEDPTYVNGGANSPTGGSAGTKTPYTAGPSITNPSTSSGGSPDTASNTAAASGPSLSSCADCPTSNPSGVDRARYVYKPGSGGIRVGVVGLTSGSGNVKAFFDDGTATSSDAGNYKPDNGETQAPNVVFTVSPGGQPGTAEAAAAVTQIVVEPTDDAAPAGQAQPFTATLLNGSGDGVRGVRPLIQVASNGANPGASATCAESDNNGVSRCSFTGSTPGTDTLTVYVNKAGGSAGPDSFEAKTVVTRTTTKPAVAAAEARYLDLTPKSQTVQAGRPDTFTATITDVNGAPAQNVSVTFTLSGPGQFANSSTSFTGFTDNTGRVRARINTVATDRGTQNVTAAISTINTQCSQPAGAGNGSTTTTPAGRCSDTATGTVTGASPSPTPTRSATPTSTISPSPTRGAIFLRTSTPDIHPNETGVLDATGQPNAQVELRCYTRPNVNYTTPRPPANISASGNIQFRILPGANTRCYVRYTGDDTTASNQVVINVHTTLSLSTVRTGTRTYVFQGRNLPRRPGQLITLYRIDSSGNEIRTANLKTDSSGIYRVTRKFTGVGTFRFRVRTSQTLNNAAGFSTTITVTVR